MNCGECRPDERRKWPCSSAPRSSRVAVVIAPPAPRESIRRLCADCRLREPDGHDDVVAARIPRFARRHDALLIPVRCTGRPNAGGERFELGAEELLERLHLVRTAHDAAAARIARERGEPRRVFAGAAYEPELAQVLGRQARQHGHRKDLRRANPQLVGALLRGFDRGLHHLAAAQRVHVDDARLRANDRAHRASDGVRDIVELEIEEIRLLAPLQIVEKVAAVPAKRLKPYFVHQRQTAQRFDYPSRVRKRRHVERDDQGGFVQPASPSYSSALRKPTFALPTISSSALMLRSRRYSSSSATIRVGMRGSVKFAVPIETAEAPAKKNSRASRVVSMPPWPTIGMRTARATS